MKHSNTLFILVSTVPVAAAFLLDYISKVCLSRSNVVFSLATIAMFADLITYHSWARLLGYTPGDYSTPVLSICEVLYLSHGSAATEMGTMVTKLEDGIAERTNNLGWHRLTDKVFTCKDEPVFSHGYCGIALGMPHEDHSRVRLFLDELFGDGDSNVPWGTDGKLWSLSHIETKAGEFLQGRSSLKMGGEAGIFFVMYIHETLMGIVLTEEETTELVSFFSLVLLRAILIPMSLATNANRLRKQREDVIALYVDAIEARRTSLYITTLNDEDVLLAANYLLDALTFAAVPSLTATSAAVLGVYLHNLGGTNDIEGFDWSSPDDIGLAVMEAVRAYPPVLGIPYVEDNTEHVSMVGYAGYDSSVFGEDSHDYRIRFETVELYRDVMINWADRAYPVTGKPETSHICPGRSLSFNLLVGFLVALDVTSWMEDDEGKPKVPKNGSGPVFWPSFGITRVVDV